MASFCSSYEGSFLLRHFERYYFPRPFCRNYGCLRFLHKADNTYFLSRNVGKGATYLKGYIFGGIYPHLLLAEYFIVFFIVLLGKFAGAWKSSHMHAV